MKKLKIIVTGLVAAITVTSFTACDIHFHTYFEEWNFNEMYHWHDASCEDTDRTFGEAVHTFGEWESAGRASCAASSSEARACTVCGYEEVRELEATGDHSYTEKTDFLIEEGVAYYTMQCTCGATQNVVADDILVATPSTAQSILDGEAGSLDGKTVYFTQGEYTETLILGRPTKYEGSNTTFKGVQGENEFTTVEDIKAMTWGSRYYTRALSNVTFTGEEGVVLPGMTMSSGHVYGTGYDYVLDQEYEGSGYYLTHTIENLTFIGLSFSGNVDFNTSQVETTMNGLTFIDCSFDLGGTDSTAGAGLRVYCEINGKVQIANLTVRNCTFKNVYQGIYTSHVKIISVTESEFDTTGHNAVAVQTNGDKSFDHGEVTISDNVFKNIGDRIIRFNCFGGAVITITNNVATDSGDEDGEVIKATSLVAGVVYNISGNDWGEGRIVGNPEFEDAQPTE